MLRRVCVFPEGFSSVGKFKPQGIEGSPSYKYKEREQTEIDKTAALLLPCILLAVRQSSRAVKSTGK